MRLSKRIYAICDAVKSGETIADVGTDHGYVPMLLIRNNVSPYAIMADISDGSLSKARQTFEQCCIETEPNQFRLGDGLECINNGEVDDIIIGGLGGLTISEILDADEAKTRSFRKLILQPRKHSGNLRHYLYTHGYDIVSETLVPEGKFVCEIFCAVPAEEPRREELYPVDDIRWKYPMTLADADIELLNKRVGWKIDSIEEEINNLNKSKRNVSAEIEQLEADRIYLRSLLDKCQENSSGMK
ncbi:MAG: SAM-dependent methyltransferase [Clostridiales bacterium]|nr:SAM-dependent methyltransferase [Candidatus Crickella caballi]